MLRGQRLSSTTTRIKTIIRSCKNVVFIGVRDYLPLQQGLRLSHVDYFASAGVVRDYLPLQQGLRLRCHHLLWHPCMVRDYLPLQQGLRPVNHFPKDNHLQVRDYLPLQQGLRRHLKWVLGYLNEPSETIFHYNKD